MWNDSKAFNSKLVQGSKVFSWASEAFWCWNFVGLSPLLVPITSEKRPGPRFSGAGPSLWTLKCQVEEKRLLEDQENKIDVIVLPFGSVR